MSLATRCSACGTIFRVVEDQLKISDGWVRCGRCDTVFDALDGMVDLDQLPVAADDGATDPPVRTEPDRAPTADAAPIDIHHLLARTEDPRDELPDRPTADQRAPDNDDRAGHAVDLDDAAVAAIPVAPATAVDPDGVPGDRHAEVEAATPAAPISTAPSYSLPPLAAAGRPASPPSFVQQAEREAHWNSPAMRAALIGSSVILLLLLALQVVFHQRDAIAARSPLAAEWLRSACARWNCSIEAPRKIREVTIENSALTKLADQPHAARLSLTLRNRGSGDLAMPAVELSLTDFEGRLIARKALLPGVFRVDPPVIPAHSELPVQVIVSAGERRIAGYTVELFYP